MWLVSFLSMFSTWSLGGFIKIVLGFSSYFDRDKTKSTPSPKPEVWTLDWSWTIKKTS